MLFLSRYRHHVRKIGRLRYCLTGISHRNRPIPSNYGRLLSTSYSIGDVKHGFKVIEVVPVPEFSMEAIQLEHEKTGAQYLHLNRNDGNNTFGISFRTTPKDSTGVAHILEHTVLCGSHRYPCRDPFFNMLSRSVATFMNAMTGSDFTCYPFATQNHQDFKNLMSVYLDSVFNPHLRLMDFNQEGWRLENETYNDKSSPVIIKGVVYNEMKGVFSSSNMCYMRQLQSALYPTSTYSHESGGDPQHIPSLSHQNLVDFHRLHYHPSNARFYTYGNFPLESHLERVNEVISKFEKIAPDTDVIPQTPWTEPRKVHLHIGYNPLLSEDIDSQHYVSVSYMMQRITNIDEVMGLLLLSNLLLDKPSSPLQVALLESKLGMDLTPLSGFQADTVDSYLSCGLQGVRGAQVDQVPQLVRDTLSRVLAQGGFTRAQWERELHQMELSKRHQREQFGLAVMMNCLPVWNHTRDVTEFVQFDKHVHSLRQRLEADTHYLVKLMERYLLPQNNPHELTLIMSPDEQYEARLAKGEQELITRLTQDLDDSHRQNIYQRGLELHDAQCKQSDVTCLPTLQMSDIPRTRDVTQLNHHSIDGVQVQTCVADTNNLTYLRLVADTSCVPDDLKLYIPLCTQILTQIGTDKYDYKQLNDALESVCSGVDCDVHLSVIPQDTQQYEQGVLLSTYFLEENLTDTLRLLSELLCTVGSVMECGDRGASEYCLSRVQTVLDQYSTQLSQGTVDNGHQYAMTRAASTLTHMGSLCEGLAGITQMQKLQIMKSNEGVGEVVKRLAQLVTLIFKKENLRLCVNGSEAGVTSCVDALPRFLSSLPSSCGAGGAGAVGAAGAGAGGAGAGGTGAGGTGAGVAPVGDGAHRYQYQAVPSRTILTLPAAQVNYCAKSLPLPAHLTYTHPHHASLRVLASLLSRKFLHSKIREQGGAYGSGARLSLGTAFTFFSYRDPESTQTLSHFAESCSWAADSSFTDQDIHEAKLSVFQSVDYPVCGNNKGVNTRFLAQLTDEMIAEHRSHLFDVNRETILDVANRYLLAAVSPSHDKYECIVGNGLDTDTPDKSWTYI